MSYYQTAQEGFSVMLNQLERDKKRIGLSDAVYNKIVSQAQAALDKVGPNAHVKALLRELRRN